MSYAMQRNGLGFLIELSTLLAATGQAKGSFCDGGELDPKTGACCPQDLWTDSTIRQVLGRDFILRRNLQNTYASLDALLGPATREGFATMIEQLSYDLGDAPAGSNLAKRVDQTRLRLHAIFPLSGFKQDTVESKEGCGSYTTWRARSFTWTPERLEVLARVTGAKPVASQLATIRPAHAWLGAMYVANPQMAQMGNMVSPSAKPWFELDPRVRDWLFSAYQVIAAAPHAPEQWDPNVEQLAPGARSVVEVIDGQLVPTAWLSALMSVFATKIPQQFRVRAPQKTKIRLPFTFTEILVAEDESRLTRQPTRTPARTPTRDPGLPPRAPAPGTSSKTSVAALGVGALAVATGAYFLTRKTR